MNIRCEVIVMTDLALMFSYYVTTNANPDKTLCHYAAVGAEIDHVDRIWYSRGLTRANTAGT